MKTGAKIALGALTAIGLGLASWGFWSFYHEPAPAPTPPPTPTPPPAPGGTTSTSPTGGGTTVTDPRTNTGFSNTPPPTPIYSGFKIGQMLFGRSPGGAISYTTKIPSTTSIYKAYPAGTKIGSFLNTEAGGMIAVAVEETNIMGIKTAKTVYVPDTKVYA